MALRLEPKGYPPIGISIPSSWKKFYMAALGGILTGIVDAPTESSLVVLHNP